MTHVDRDDLALLAAGEAASPATSAHVRGCSRCRDELAELRSTAALVGALEPDERERMPLPPERVWDAIAEELAGEVDDDAGPAADVTPLDARRPGRLGPWLAAAAAVVLVAVTAGGVALLREPSPTVVAGATLEPLAEVDPGGVRLLEDPAGLRLEIEAAGLPEPDGYYELWLIDTGVERLISLGPLVEGRQYRLPEGLDVAAFPVVDVSVEPFDGDPAHSGNSVLRGVLPVDGADGEA